MQFQDAFTFPTPLSPETEASARELLRAQQMGQLDLLMGWVQQPERLGKLGDVPQSSSPSSPRRSSSSSARRRWRVSSWSTGARRCCSAACWGPPPSGLA